MRLHPYIPVSVNGDLKNLNLTDEILYWYPWIANVSNKNTYLMLHEQWGPSGEYPDPPPPGYEYYITSGDSLMFGLPEQIAANVDGKIIHLTGSILPDSFDTNQITYMSYNTAHRRIAGIPHIPDFKKNLRYKASALTNRVTQSKAIIFAALMHYLGQENCTVSLNNNFYHTKNIHDWQLTGNDVCDSFSEFFRKKWQDKKITLDDDDGKFSDSYNNSAYKQAALNFTQESYHYSFTVQGGRSFIQPGPFVTEKTWKAILSSSAFIPVGQCYVYKWLTSLGLQFDYGPLDLSFDEDPGNLTRIEKIVALIKSLQQWSAQDLYAMTCDSTRHNQQHVKSAEFWNLCEQSNSKIYNLMASLK